MTIYIALDKKTYFNPMSDYHCHYSSRNCPGSDRFFPCRITSRFVMMLLIFAVLFIPVASAAPAINGITPATGLNTSTVLISDLNGTGFLSGASVMLTPVNVNPFHHGSVHSGSGGALLENPLGVFVSGNYAYVTSNTSNALEIVDISNPASPVHAGNIVNGSGGALLENPFGFTFPVTTRMSPVLAAMPWKLWMSRTRPARYMPEAL